MDSIPRTRSPDSTLAFLREGYRFVSRRCSRLGSQAFETRLMLRPVVCTRGAEAAGMFYVPGRFTRRGALPRHTLRLLQDEGSVATLDGAAHARRKAMFMAMMEPDALGRLRDIAAWETDRYLERCGGTERVNLHDTLAALFTQVGLAWCGLPLETQALVAFRQKELVAMIDGAGAIGPRALYGHVQRRRTEEWARVIVARVRAGELEVGDETPLAVIAFHHDDDGRQLPIETAAVELINILHPTTAVAWYGVFAALALHEHPAHRDAMEDETFRLAFVDEVRRFYPFFPVVAGRALESFAWLGRDFVPGDWVMLDLYGTNRDPALWPQPARFDPGRFLAREPTPFDLIPQGGGHYRDGHRCPGEPATRLLLDVLVQALARRRYDVPEQDLSIDLGRLPARPASGFVVENLR